MDELNEARYQNHLFSGKLGYSLALFGDDLAIREQYKSHKGMDAIYFYLVEKYNWLPSVVKSMNNEDIRFLLEEEMIGWAMPENARPSRNSEK